jgi:hypothetical protein
MDETQEAQNGDAILEVAGRSGTVEGIHNV